MPLLKLETDNIQGLDDLLAKHISHLFIRDPIVVFQETVGKDDKASSDHFEVIFYKIDLPLARKSNG